MPKIEFSEDQKTVAVECAPKQQSLLEFLVLLIKEKGAPILTPVNE